MPWATNDWRKDSPRGIISSESSLAHAGSIGNDKCGNVLVTHLEKWWGWLVSGPKKVKLANEQCFSWENVFLYALFTAYSEVKMDKKNTEWALGSACCIKIKVAMHVFRSLWGVFMPKYGHVRNLKHKNSLFLKSSIQQDNLCHHRH